MQAVSVYCYVRGVRSVVIIVLLLSSVHIVNAFCTHWKLVECTFLLKIGPKHLNRQYQFFAWAMRAAEEL